MRPRLLDRLGRRFTLPVTVVVAPAGLGKTTLLAQAVADNRLEPRGVDHWLTCTADDSAESSLAEGLCRALGTKSPGNAERATEVVTEAMWHRSPDELVLVLDDVHEVVRGTGGAALLKSLLEALPRNGHVVLSGRQPPPLPLSRLDVEGQVLRLGEADLILTDQELAEFAAQRGVPIEQLSASAGWPALAELAAHATPGVEAAYLWEEVLEGIEPERRRELALLAHVGAFDNELATAALGHEADLSSLTELLPLVATTSEGARQIHPLWRPHLAQVVTAEEIAETRQRAGVELAKSGDVAAAVRLLTDAGAWGDVTRVVTDVLAAAGPVVPGDVLAAWLGRLPGDMSEGPLARLLGAVAAERGDVREVMRDLEEAADAFRRQGDLAGELAAMVQLARLAWLYGEADRLGGLAARLFEMEALGHQRAVALACLARALIANMGTDAEGVLRELDRIPAASLGGTWLSVADWLRSLALYELGRPAEALEAATRGCDRASPLYAPTIEIVQLQARWTLGEVDEVVDYLPQFVERSTTTGLHHFAVLMSAYTCTSLAFVGRRDEAAPYLERARSSAPVGIPLVDARLVIAEAVLAVASGQEEDAVRVLHDYMERSSPLGPGLAAFVQQQVLSLWYVALWYVLAPASRPMWDSAPLGPSSATGRDLAQALVAVRDGGRLPAGSPRLPAPGVVRAHLPLPWASELALAHIAAGRQAGWQLLEALWPQAQPDVHRHASRAGGPLSRPARTALARLPLPPPASLELRLLGPAELRCQGRPVDAPEWRRGPVRALLAHLVLNRPVSRERLATDLWPDLDREAASRNLRVTLTHLLRALEPERGERHASFLVRPHGDGLLLHRGPWFSTDIWLFDELSRGATDADLRGAPSAALDAMRRAVALWRGDPSELTSHSWAIPEVENRRLRLVELAVRAGDLLLTRDEPTEARQMGNNALSADPWSERAHHIVIAAHAALDDRTGTRRAIERYRDALTDIGIRPDDIVRKLEQLPQPRAASTR